MLDMLRQFLQDESGAELAEYAVAIALLVAVAVVVYEVLGNGISDANSVTTDKIKNAKIDVKP